ncbi:YkyA family protein [Jeotgalibaca sp. A127]|uniref:YkyA family protein n=1 Tax=Jeotgalibaca sp. A127 TaxID=3457324 RepID=UPI003FD1C083
MIKRSAWFLLASGIVLAGCSSGVEKTQKSVDKLADSKEAIIVSLNTIQQKEMEIQKQFDEALTADEELATFSDGSAPVFKNISVRQEEVANLEENLSKMKGHVMDLSKLEVEEVPAEKMQKMLDTAQTFINQVEAYLPAYTEQLQAEEEIFASFGAEDATFNTLYDGVNTLNKNGSDNLAKLEPLVGESEVFETQMNLLTDALTPDDE